MPQVASEAQASSLSRLRPTATARPPQGADRAAAAPFASFFEHAGYGGDGRVARKGVAHQDQHRINGNKPADPANKLAAHKDPASKNNAGANLAAKPDRDDGVKTGDVAQPDGVEGIKTGDALPPDRDDGVKTGDAAQPDSPLAKTDDDQDTPPQAGDATTTPDVSTASDDIKAQQLAGTPPADPAQPAVTAAPASAQPTAMPLAESTAPTAGDITPPGARPPVIGAAAQIGAEPAQPALAASPPRDAKDESSASATARQPGDDADHDATKIMTADASDDAGHAAVKNSGATQQSASQQTPAASAPEPAGAKAAAPAESHMPDHAELAVRHAAQIEKAANPAAEPHAAMPQPGADSALAPPVPQAPPTNPSVALAAGAPLAQATAAVGIHSDGKIQQSPAVPLENLGVEIAAKAKAGKNQFDIRLDPPELGRIEVRLHVDDSGQVTSRLVADRLDTLDLLRRDSAGLERALQDVGLKTSSGGLQFSLRDHGSGQHGPALPSSDRAHLVISDDMLPANDIAQRPYRGLAGLRGGLDIRV